MVRASVASWRVRPVKFRFSCSRSPELKVKHDIVQHLMILPPLRPLPLRSFRSTDIWHFVSSLQPLSRLPKSRAPAKKTDARRTIFSTHLQHVSRKDTFPDWEGGTPTPATGGKVSPPNAGAESREDFPLEHGCFDAVNPGAPTVDEIDVSNSVEDSKPLLDDELDVITDEHPLAFDHYDAEVNGARQGVLHNLNFYAERVMERPSSDDSTHEFTAAQLEHQLQLDTDADRLGRIIRGPLKIYRSDRIQRKTWELLNQQAEESDQASVISGSSSARSKTGPHMVSTEENYNGPTATLLRHQMLASDGAFELERTLRLALEDDVGRGPQDNESKTKKAARLLNQPSMHDLIVSRFAALPGPRYEITLLSGLLQKIRAADQVPNERLLWTALNTAALAHAPEAMRRYLFALGIDLSTPVRAVVAQELLRLPSEVLTDSHKIKSKAWTSLVHTSLTPSRLAELVGNLKTGFSNGSAFARSSRHPTAMVEILEVLSDKLKIQGSSSTVAMFSQWRILYPWIWMLSESGAGDRIQAIWDLLGGDRRNRTIQVQLANFFIHMLFRAGSPARAWFIYDDMVLHLQPPEDTLRKSTPEEREIYHPQQYLNKAMIAHIQHAPDTKDPELRRRFAEAILKHYETELGRIENKMGIRWLPRLGYHEHIEERGLEGAADNVVSSPEPQYHDMLKTRRQLPGFISRPIFSKKWPAADDALGSFLSVGECEVHDTDFLAWKDLPSFLRSTEELPTNDDVWSMPLPASQVKSVRNWRKSAKRRARRIEAKQQKAASQEQVSEIPSDP